MDATEILRQEHRLIEQVLYCPEKLVEQCAGSNQLPADPAREAIAFFRDYADHCHHEKEETHLFPALEAAGFPREVGPTGVMLAEHEQGRSHIRAMESTVEAASAGDAEGVTGFLDHARAYIRLLRDHIRKEEDCVFPLVHQAIDPVEQDRLTTVFERLASGQAANGTTERCTRIAGRRFVR